MSDLFIIFTCDEHTHLKSVEDAPRVEEDTLPSILVRPGKNVVGGGSDSSQREVLLRTHEKLSDGDEAERYSEKMTSVHPRLYTKIFIQNDSIFTCGQKVLELIGNVVADSETK